MSVCLSGVCEREREYKSLIETVTKVDSFKRKRGLKKKDENLRNTERNRLEVGFPRVMVALWDKEGREGDMYGL